MLGAQIVDLLGGDAGLDGGDVVQHIRSKAACHAHALDVFGVFSVMLMLQLSHCALEHAGGG
jgi:hypothetical protein